MKNSNKLNLLERERQEKIRLLKNAHNFKLLNIDEKQILEIEIQMVELNKLDKDEKQIHIIWIGKLPKGELNNLKLWAKFNPDFKINIWCDSNHTLTPKLNSLITFNSRSKEKEARLKDEFYNNYLLKNTKNSFNENAIKFLIDKKFSTISELDSFLQTAESILLEEQKNIQEEFTDNAVLIRDIAVEQNSLFMNKDIYKIYLEDLERSQFASTASDIFRYSILHNEGGIYLDTDCVPKFNLEEIFSIPYIKETIISLINESEYETGQIEYDKSETIINELVILIHLNKMDNNNIQKLTQKWTRTLGGNFKTNLEYIIKISELLKKSNLDFAPLESISNFPINNCLGVVAFERKKGKIFTSFLISKKKSPLLEECLKEILICDEKNKNMNMLERIQALEQIAQSERGPSLFKRKLLVSIKNFFDYHPSNIENFCSMSSLNSITSSWCEWKPKQEINAVAEPLLEDFFQENEYMHSKLLL